MKYYNVREMQKGFEELGYGRFDEKQIIHLFKRFEEKQKVFPYYVDEIYKSIRMIKLEEELEYMFQREDIYYPEARNNLNYNLCLKRYELEGTEEGKFLNSIELWRTVFSEEEIKEKCKIIKQNRELFDENTIEDIFRNNLTSEQIKELANFIEEGYMVTGIYCMYEDYEVFAESLKNEVKTDKVMEETYGYLVKSKLEIENNPELFTEIIVSSKYSYFVKFSTGEVAKIS